MTSGDDNIDAWLRAWQAGVKTQVSRPPSASASVRAPVSRDHSKRTIIKTSKTPEELDELFRFRYKIYVEEMNRKQHHADHRGKRIQDPLDDFATNFVAIDSSGDIIGAVRVNLARDGNLGKYEAFYEMQKFGSFHPNSTSISTRLMVRAQHRKTTLAVRLCSAVYEFVLLHGVIYNFIDCNDHLVKFFLGLGFVSDMPKRHHDEYGDVNCMYINLRDREHLERISSPFLKSYDHWAAVTMAPSPHQAKFDPHLEQSDEVGLTAKR